MTDPDSNFDIDSLLPDWSRSVFLVLERNPHWSSAVAAEFRTRLVGTSAVRGADHELLAGGVTEVDFVSLTASRDVVARLGTTTVLGIIAVLSDVERDGLVLLGRLARLSRAVPPVLMLGDARHRELVPVLYEAGASSVLIDQPTDIHVAEWCRNVVQLTGRNGGRGNEQDV
ncbi:MAG: hypothetical protein R3C19_20515 [Planctomycetaceae bacterium]